MAGEAVVGSYSYRDEVKQKHYTAEGDKSKMFPNIYECVFYKYLLKKFIYKYLRIYLQAGLHTVSYIADSEGFRLL